MRKLLSLLLFTGLWSAVSAQDYRLIGWNDLGMHCANKEFANFAILPPYNNITATLIKYNDPARFFPQPVTEGYTVTYEIPGNSYSVGKTNFWSYEDKLFGISLADNIGLTGNGLSGTMTAAGSNFVVTGIPITPYTDADLTRESPYQLALLKAFDSSGNLLASTQCVVPVSNEINCISSGCHSSETSMLSQHDDEGGYDANARPILCANCHASAALGTAGRIDVPSLSLAIHDKHKKRTGDCYKCHPGTNTKCLRDIHFSKGLTCRSCHGTIAEVANSILSGRRPWLDEPKCGAPACHGSLYAEESGKLFRESRGHGGLYCSTCHGSPHAIVPSVEPNDNLQNITLQGNSRPLYDCRVCHGIILAAGGPHGIGGTTAVALLEDSALPRSPHFQPGYPNPFNSSTRLTFELPRECCVSLTIYNTHGVPVRTLLVGTLAPGSHAISWDGTGDAGRALPSGIYYGRLQTSELTLTQKLTLIR